MSRAKPGSHLCDCGKWITLTSRGLYRRHDSLQPDSPGSRFKKICSRSGTPVEA
jgi:hypothetical protein